MRRARRERRWRRCRCFALLFVPMLPSACTTLFHWSHAEAVAHDPLLQRKQPYLNARVLPRSARRLYFVVWSRARALVPPAVAAPGRDRRPASSPRRLRRSARRRSILFALTHHLRRLRLDDVARPALVLDDLRRLLLRGLRSWPSSRFLALVAVALRRAGLLARRGHRRAPPRPRQAALRASPSSGPTSAFSPVLPDLVRQHPGGDRSSTRERLARRLEPARRSLLAVGHFVVPFFFLMPRTVKRNAAALAAGGGLAAGHALPRPVLARDARPAPEGLAPGLLDARGAARRSAVSSWRPSAG